MPESPRIESVSFNEEDRGTNFYGVNIPPEDQLASGGKSWDFPANIVKEDNKSLLI